MIVLSTLSFFSKLLRRGSSIIWQAGKIKVQCSSNWCLHPLRMDMVLVCWKAAKFGFKVKAVETFIDLSSGIWTHILKSDDICHIPFPIHNTTSNSYHLVFVTADHHVNCSCGQCNYRAHKPPVVVFIKRKIWGKALKPLKYKLNWKKAKVYDCLRACEE